MQSDLAAMTASEGELKADGLRGVMNGSAEVKMVALKG